jgi:tetratricopeptide (TPR) repeat protein
LWVPFELGRPFGPPSDSAFQTRVVTTALQLLERPSGPVVLEDFSDDDPREQPDPTWQAIGQSAAALAGGDLHGALDAGTRAVGTNPGSFHANYQLGLVKAKMNDWAGAAEAFGRAAEIDPGFAYAHYYAGIANSRIKRADLTAVHLEQFLKLAPMAPERPAMESLMRTLRGR